MAGEKNHLIFAILRFFEEELLDSSMDPDARETLEVASQCLENVYKINSSDPATKAKYPLPANLLDIFKAGLKQKLDENALKEVTPEEKAKADQFKSEGNTKMKAEQYNEAIESYTKAIDIDPRNAVYFCNRAAAYSKLEKHSEALSDCVKALDIDPQYSKAYGRKGLAHSALNQHKEAVDSFEKAVELDPTNESYKKNLEIAEQKCSEQNVGGMPGGIPGFPGMGGIPGMGGMPGGMPGGFPAGMDFSSLLNNPALMNMATQMMSNPQMQQMMANLMGGMMPGSQSGGGTGEGAGPGQGGAGAPGPGGPAGPDVGGAPDLSSILQMGQQIASQFQQSHPELVDQFRQQAQASNPSNTEQTDSQNNQQAKDGSDGSAS